MPQAQKGLNFGFCLVSNGKCVQKNRLRPRHKFWFGALNYIRHIIFEEPYFCQLTWDDQAGQIPTRNRVAPATDLTYWFPSHEQYSLKMAHSGLRVGLPRIWARLLVPRITFQMHLPLPMGKEKPIWDVTVGTSVSRSGWGRYFCAFLPIRRDGGASELF